MAGAPSLKLSNKKEGAPSSAMADERLMRVAAV